jgi:hypothetical protein
MPEKAEKQIEAQGGAKRWRTISLPSRRYLHVAVTRKEGPRGGETVATEPKEKESDG